jgi:hypothetical protein
MGEVRNHTSFYFPSIALPAFDQSLANRGVIGRVSSALIPEILRAIDGNSERSPKDKVVIRAFLDPTGDQSGITRKNCS